MWGYHNYTRVVKNFKIRFPELALPPQTCYTGTSALVMGALRA